MKNKLLRVLTVAAMAGGLAFAQSPGAGRAFRPGARVQRLVQTLDLTTDQQAMAKEIFGASAASARPLAQQLRDARKQLNADVKAGAAEDVLTKDSNAVGTLTSQLTVIRAKARQQFYGILTPEQKAKFDSQGAGRRGMRG